MSDQAAAALPGAMSRQAGRWNARCEVVRRAHTRARTKLVHQTQTWAPRACGRRRGRPSTPWAPAYSWHENFLLFFFEALKVHAPVESVLRPTGRCQEGRRGCGAGMPARVTVVSTTQLAVAPRTCALDATHRRLIIGPAPLPLLLRRAPKVFASVFALAGC